MKTKTLDQIEKRGRVALEQLDWARRRIEELKRNSDWQRAELAKIQADLDIIKKRDSSMPPEWSALASCGPPNIYQ